MAPTRRVTRQKPEKTNVGEQVLDLVIPYVHNVEDRNSLSLVSRKCYATEGITRKRLTVHVRYTPNPASLRKRFPFIESLTLKGPPCKFSGMRITPWIQQIALEFRCLKEIYIRHLVVHDEDLETLARTHGKDLRSLSICKCEGYSTDGLMHVSKYCHQLRTLCLDYSYDLDVRDGNWLHELALNSTVLEMFKFKNTDISHGEDLTLLAKNCSNSLVSFKIGKCYLSKLGDAFRYAVRLEHFSGDNCDDESNLVGFQFPQHTCYISIQDLPVIRRSLVFPLLNRIRKLKLLYLDTDEKCQCLLFKSCPNLEVLYTEDVCGDSGLQVIGKFCKKLRKLTYYGLVTHVGLISLAKECINMEYLDVFVRDISNEALECIGTRMKNLRDFRICLRVKDGITILPLDYGVRAMLMGCNKLERLYISLQHGGLTDLGLKYVGKYGANLRFLGLGCVGNSNVGLVNLSQGCQKLRKLTMTNCPFSEQVVTNYVFNMPSLRYVWGDIIDRTPLALTRPEFQLCNIGMQEQVGKEVSNRRRNMRRKGNV